MALETAAQYDTKLIVEEFIQGREIECAVLGNDDPQALYTLGLLAAVLEADGKLSEAEAARTEALGFRSKGGEDQTAQVLQDLKGFVRVLNLQKKFGEAEKTLNDTLSSTFMDGTTICTSWLAAAGCRARIRRNKPRGRTRFSGSWKTGSSFS